MANNKPSFAAVAALMKELSASEQEVLLSSDNRPALKTFLQNQVVYPAEVNYNLTIEQSLMNSGLWKEYDGHETFEINTYTFEVTGSGVVRFDLVLVGFDIEMLPGEAKTAIRSMGLRPARVEHLNAFVASGHEPLLDSNDVCIVALGSNGKDADGEPVVAVLDYKDGSYDIWTDQDDPDNAWKAGTKFMAYKVVG